MWKEVIIAPLIIILLAVLLGFYGATVEQSTYNRITGNDVTWWEAVWTNLRVDCN